MSRISPRSSQLKAEKLLAGRRHLCVFAKIPLPGRVKTRLSPALKPTDATWLYDAFLLDLTRELSDGPYGMTFFWALEAEEKTPTHPVIGSQRQEGADLGERLRHAAETALKEAPFVVIVGSDMPELQQQTVRDAFRQLEAGVPVVLGPSADGGYYLIGLRRETLAAVDLFGGIPWSTDQVAEITRERCRQAGLEIGLLPLGHDIDTPEDLEGLAERLRSAPASRCSFTRVLLREWRRL